MNITPSILDPATLRVIEFTENSVILRFTDGGTITIRASSTGDLVVDE